ncbi:hypothetical protein [Microvirga mediterraneensis]|uniref:Uncharacterized protein n=1 Tax=Microvirga mediterraneensis TaxID=2754695 RepID=A0A838BW63_9HYPH|nr:hypothetical protein [Microvirga mediterraneensis]MBA1159123.1 hypothetical protein [Microvirga mediterraneensis]
MRLSPDQTDDLVEWARQTPGVQEVRLFTGSSGEHDPAGVDLALTLGGFDVGDPLTLYWFERERWEASLAMTLGLPVTLHWYDAQGAPKVYATYQGHSFVVYSGKP